MTSEGLLLGYDIGSSSVKATLLDIATGASVASATSPEHELEIVAPRPGWAEQDPDVWWEHVVQATQMLRDRATRKLDEVRAIGISYQMHGLVLVGKDGRPLRRAIIWCDSRAVEIGALAFAEIGEQACLSRLLNSPGNFTASKLKWVMENEPALFAAARHMMLPGDYIALRMTGETTTTPTGLSEGILWDFQSDAPAELLLSHYGIPRELLPRIVPTFSEQGRVSAEAAKELGLPAGTPITYRAGDQPNNALSLNVLNPGEVAATAGTSGVVCGIGDRAAYDAQSRVNTFLHVNHAAGRPRYATLLCVNGSGILLSWLRRNVLAQEGRNATYEEMNALAASAPVGADGLVALPYGNGAERSLGNRDVGASIHGLAYNRHTRAHVLRAAQEGVAFALNYGIEIMEALGIRCEKVRAGNANMFLSPLFGEAFATTTGAQVELFRTDGSQGAARGAGMGAGIYRDAGDAFAGLVPERTIAPEKKLRSAYQDAYARWRETLVRELKTSGSPAR